MSLVAWLLAPVVLALSRLLPATGVGLGVRLGAATACLLLPGALLSRALGVRGFAGAFVWSMAALFGATAVMFAVHGSLWLALALFFAVAVVALPFAARRPDGVSIWELGVLVLGVAAGISLWWIARYDGDAFFHLARVQKLLAFDSLSLRSVDEFKDGGLHPGYAYPLWHAAVALIARLAGVGAPAAVLHLPTVLLPVSFALVYEAGTILFASRWAGVATALAEFALLSLAPGHGGADTSLALPASASRALFLPALLALVFAYIREPSALLLASVAAGAGAMTLVHPSYSVLLGVALAGFLVVRALVDRRDVAHVAAALAAIAVPAGLVALWLLPIVRETVSHNPSQGELRRAFAGYGQELDVSGLHSYRLNPELWSRAGAVAVASLALLPLAVFAYRRMWGAFPGDFGSPYRFVHGGPRLLTWIAFGAALAALVAAAFFGRRIPQVEGPAPLAAAAVALFLIPVAVHGYSHWTRAEKSRTGLPQKLVTAVRAEVPKGDVVFSDPLTAYELAAFAPVYINAAPEAHVANTKANRPAARVKAAQRFFRDGGPLSVPRRGGARWLLVDRARVRPTDFKLPRAYTGSRYVLYRLP
jgi:hypothetical protein